MAMLNSMASSLLFATAAAFRAPVGGPALRVVGRCTPLRCLETTTRTELQQAQSELVKLTAELERGALVDEPKRQRLEELVALLESSNTVEAPLQSPLINGRWELLYTTSRSSAFASRQICLRQC
jgi:hypothetical protein